MARRSPRRTDTHKDTLTTYKGTQKDTHAHSHTHHTPLSLHRARHFAPKRHQADARLRGQRNRPEPNAPFARNKARTKDFGATSPPDRRWAFAGLVEGRVRRVRRSFFWSCAVGSCLRRSPGTRTPCGFRPAWDRQDRSHGGTRVKIKPPTASASKSWTPPVRK